MIGSRLGELPPLVYTVDVAVALARPPRVDQYRRYRILAVDDFEAALVALYWAWNSPGVVMPVGAEVVDVEV